MKWARPHEWNIGAAIIVRSPARIGIRENIAASGPSVSGCARWAPFGDPVVPEVRITNRLDSSGGSRSASSAVGDQLVERRIVAGAVLGPGDEPQQVPARPRRAARRTRSS